MYVLHRLLLRRGCGGWSPSWRRVATWRRAISAIAHAGLGHFLPLIKLFRRKDGFHLRGHIVTKGLAFGLSFVLGKAGILTQLLHFLPLRVYDGLHFRFLVGGQVELVKVGTPSHARRTLAGWRSACGWSGRRRVGGITRAQGRTPHQQTAHGQCRD